MYPLQRWAWTQKTPEMNELESDKQNLKRWDSNFEKQKNYSISTIHFFCQKKKDLGNKRFSPFKGGGYCYLPGSMLRFQGELPTQKHKS